MTWSQGPIEAVSPLATKELLPVERPAPLDDATLGVPGTGFGQLVGQGLAQVNQQLMAAQTDLQRLATGDVQNLHQVMIRLEESRLSFQLMLQIRNRLLEAYQDVMKMQV